MVITGFLGGKHPGSDPVSWEKPCAAGRAQACRVLAQTLDVECQHNSANACFTLGNLLNGGKGLPAIRSVQGGVLSTPATSA